MLGSELTPLVVMQCSRNIILQTFVLVHSYPLISQPPEYMVQPGITFSLMFATHQNVIGTTYYSFAVLQHLRHPLLEMFWCCGMVEYW